MSALFSGPAVAPPENNLEQYIKWIGQTKLDSASVMSVLTRLIKTIHVLNHLSFTKLEFIRDAGFPTGKKYIVLDRQVRNDCYFLLRIKGVVGVRVSVRTRHHISPGGISAITQLYEEKRKMETESNVVQIRPNHAPAQFHPTRKPAPQEHRILILEPETPLVFYEGGPIPDEWLRYFYRHLKHAFPNRPAFISTQDLMPLVKKLFNQGYHRSALHGFFKTEIASFAKKTAEETGWEFHWRAVSAYIHGEPHPTLPSDVEKPVLPNVPPEELSFVERVLLSKRRPELEARLQELQLSETAILLQMEEIQIRLNQIRSEQQAVQVDLTRSILSPQDEEDLKKIQAAMA